MTGPARSRLLARVEADLASAQRAGEQLKAQELAGQRATLLVRQGDLDAAREALTALHQTAFSSPHPVLAAWINLAEGLLAYYTDFGQAARDRLERSLALARSAGHRPVQAQAHAFLALLCLAHARIADCGRHLTEGFALAEADDHMARSRLNMVVAMALHHGGDAEAAGPWYGKARLHAAAAGDDATLSALIHNNAQYRVAEVRRAAAQGLAAQTAGLLPGVQSINNYDSAMGINALDMLTPLLRAQVLVVTEDPAQALALFEEHLPHALANGLARMGSSLMAEVAWCRLQLGQRDAALTLARENELELDIGCDADDLAITYSRLAQVFAGLDLPQDAQRYQVLADHAWAHFRGIQASWCAMVRQAGLRPA